MYYTVVEAVNREVLSNIWIWNDLFSRYTAVARMETFPEDTSYIIHRFGNFTYICLNFYVSCRSIITSLSIFADRASRTFFKLNGRTRKVSWCQTVQFKILKLSWSISISVSDLNTSGKIKYVWEKCWIHYEAKSCMFHYKDLLLSFPIFQAAEIHLRKDSLITEG